MAVSLGGAMERNIKPKQEFKAGPMDTVADLVNEASQESFPASDAPSWAMGTEERGKADPTQGCAISFMLPRERRNRWGVWRRTTGPQGRVRTARERKRGGWRRITKPNDWKWLCQANARCNEGANASTAALAAKSRSQVDCR